MPIPRGVLPSSLGPVGTGLRHLNLNEGQPARTLLPVFEISLILATQRRAVLRDSTAPFLRFTFCAAACCCASGRLGCRGSTFRLVDVVSSFVAAWTNAKRADPGERFPSQQDSRACLAAVRSRFPRSATLENHFCRLERRATTRIRPGMACHDANFFEAPFFHHRQTGSDQARFRYVF